MKWETTVMAGRLQIRTYKLPDRRWYWLAVLCAKVHILLLNRDRCAMIGTTSR